MRLSTILILAVCLLLLLSAGFLLMTFRDLGGFRKIEAADPHNCRPVLGVLSSEDIVIDSETGMAFISGDDRRGTRGQRVNGAIYSYSLKAPSVQPEDLTADLELEFHPHGIGLYRGPDQRKSLFVVNHRAEGDYVEIFDIRDSRLFHRQSVTNDLLSDLNDVVAVDERRFYVTRDHGYRSTWTRRLEECFRIGGASVLYYDGQDFRLVAEGLAYANGINKSPDGFLLYVSATLERTVHIYSRYSEDGSLTREDEIFLDTGVDNIDVDSQGNLWIAAHPNLLDFVQYSRDSKVLSPSEVLKVSFPEKGIYRVEQIYLSDGQYLSGSSVAAKWGDQVLIGSVFDRRFLVCQIEGNGAESISPER